MSDIVERLRAELAREHADHAQTIEDAAQVARELASLREEIEQLRKHADAAPLCDEHAPNGGKRAVCLVCALQAQSAALSEICYLTEPENEYGVSLYDVHPDEHMVVRRAKEEIERLRYDFNSVAASARDLREANTKLVVAIDLILETLNGGEVQDLHQIINAALAEYRNVQKPSEAQQLGGDIYGGGRF